jgi:hypothetical protein
MCQGIMNNAVYATNRLFAVQGDADWMIDWLIDSASLTALVTLYTVEWKDSYAWYFVKWSWAVQGTTTAFA